MVPSRESTGPLFTTFDLASKPHIELHVNHISANNLGILSPPSSADPSPAVAQDHSAAHFAPRKKTLHVPSAATILRKQPKSCFCVPVIAVVLTLNPQDPSNSLHYAICCCQHDKRERPNMLLEPAQEICPRAPRSLSRLLHHTNSRSFRPPLRIMFAMFTIARAHIGNALPGMAA